MYIPWCAPDDGIVMAQCKLTPREFIGNTFSPQIAVVCSAAVDAACQKNNLSFVELLQPFCKLNTEGHFKDPQGNTVVIRNLRLSVQDINARPPEPSLAKKMLNEAVSSALCERTTAIRIGVTELDIPISVPWFEAWRETFLNVQFPSDHEFTKHVLACMIVVSTAEDNPLEKIQNMGAQLHQSIPGKLPKWFNNNALRYYILVHDTIQDDRNKAEIVFTEMKTIYDTNNCFLLQMNSRPPGLTDDNTHLPDPWSQFLTRHTELSGSSEQNSSPRTPADTSGVSAMPNELTTESDKTSQAGTPLMPQNCVTLPSPDLAETISLSSEISESTNVHLEVGQEAVPVTIHPLSPDNEKSRSFISASNVKDQSVITTSPINTNVWADSPNCVVTQHGARLSTQDLERLRTLITEFCLRSLLPYVEKQISLLNDVISNKKGVSRSLFSATRRWFGTNKPGLPGSAPSNAVIYTAESPELQLRRLGDLCFMFGHYSLAYQAYHSAKRDFAADQAWVYYAGALEMAALSAFMQGETNRKTIEYMDDAILTYANSCKMPQFATRATLLSAECLKGRGLYGEAAKQLIRMTSEDSDLRSALLLEQAAYCFIGPKMMRKYAFHAVLAGHRFSKAGQRKHSLRCYQQAYQVYYERGWSLAEDHIHFTIGRQAASLKQVSEAVKAFEKLLNASSKQSAPQQAAFLREFLHTHNLLLQGNDAAKGLPILPLPLLDSNNIKVLYGPLGKPTESDIPASHVTLGTEEADDAKWSKMEELLITEAQGSPPMIFKPTVALYSRTSNNTIKPNAVLDEPLHYSIELHNPLHVPLPLSDVTLLWSFTCNNDVITNEMETNGDSKPVDSDVVDAILLQPTCRQNIVLSLTPRRVGELKVLGLSYKLSNLVQASNDPVANPPVIVAGKRLFEITSAKLKNIKEKPGVNMYVKDYRLEMNVIEKAPFIQILFTKLSPEMLCGEIQRVEMTLKNIGNAPLRNIYIACTDAKLFTLENLDIDKSEDSTVKKNSRSVTKIVLPASKNGMLNVDDSHKMPLWVQAPHEKGTHRLDLLFYYESVESKATLKHRLRRHTWQLTVLDSIQISAIASRSGLFKNDSPTLNLIMSVKNTNQVHDPSINEIMLSKVSLQSALWSMFHSSVLPSSVKVQPQEVFHLMLKLQKKNDDELTISDVSLKPDEDDPISIDDYPFINFVQRRHIQPLDVNENANDVQQFQSQQNIEHSLISDTVALNSTLIVRWCANVTESGVVTRKAFGQHHFELEYLNKTYKHPKAARIARNEYGTRLKIFGPDRNVSNAITVPTKDHAWEAECLKNLITFSLNHVRHTTHNFQRNRLCAFPVIMYLQNHSKMRVDVKISTIGTSSETHLPNIKSQLYSPQASPYYRYAGHSSIYSAVEAHASSTVKLHALLPAPGTYDLAARIEIFVRIVNNKEYVAQKGKMESICIVNDDSI